MEEKAVEKETFTKKAKRAWDKTSIKNKLGLASVIWIIVLLVFMTITNLVLDPTVFSDPQKRNEWLIRTLILVGLSIYGILYGENVATDYLMAKEDGLYQNRLALFKEVKARVEPYVDYFSDWLEWYKIKELENKKIHYLINNSLSDAKIVIKYLDMIDTKEIMVKPLVFTDPITKEDVIIMRKSESQAKAIQDVKDGKITLVSYGSSYYISQYDNKTESYMLEEDVRLNKLEKHNIRFGRISKIVSVVVICIVLSLFTTRDFMNATNAQSWLNLVSRISALIGSIFSGWITSSETVKIKAWKLESKADVLTIFLDNIQNKKFVPKSYEEKAKEEVKEYGEEHLQLRPTEQSVD